MRGMFHYRIIYTCEISGFDFAQLDLVALRLKPCALGHFCFIIRDADKALHFVPQRTLSNFCTSVIIVGYVSSVRPTNTSSPVTGLR